MPLDKYDDYRTLCYEALQSDIPDAIQDIDALMLKCRSEYMLNWKHILRVSLIGGRVGSVARTLRMSLLTFAEQHSKADR